MQGGLVWFGPAVIYFVVAVIVGVGMGVTGNLALYTVHSHLNLLGWVSLALIGLVYRQMPDAARNRSSVAQFWLYNIGLPLMTVGLVAKGLGDTRMEPVIGAGSILVAAAVALFAANVLVHGRRAVTSGAAARSPMV
ncbi:MAG TPA: DUF2871 family protein [Vicinamibacterales bacterium]|nr:DUF2871 family protein [Vicinamibacterales bacterium]